MLKEQIFKANDIRGVVTGANPELDLDGARRLGAAFVDLLGLSGEIFVTGRDMRQLGEELAMAFADGARRAGASIIHLGSAVVRVWTSWVARSAVHRKSQPGAVQRHEILPGRRLSRALRFHR